MNGREKKVLQFVYLTHDGITSLIFNICEFIDRSKINFDYLAFAEGEKFAYEKIACYGGRPVIVNVEDIQNPFVRSIKKYYGVFCAVRKYGYQIIHVNASTPYDVLIGLAAKAGGAKRVIFHSHNSCGDKRFRRDILIPFCRLLIPFVVTDYIACSELAAKYMFPAGIYRSKAYRILHNGINVEEYVFDQAQREKIRNILGTKDAVVFGNIGRFHPQKNHEFLIEIFSEILKLKSNAMLLLIGDGELKDTIKRKAQTLSIDERIIFYGTTTEIPQMLWGMDVYLMPSLYEGLPVTGIEAQAAGLPLLVSDTVSKELRLTECVEFLSLKCSARKWAERAVSLSQKQRADHINEIRQKGYDIRSIAEQLEEIYEKQD